MSDRVPLPQPAAASPPPPSRNTLLLPLFLLTFCCCAPPAFGSAAVEEQRPWGAAEPPPAGSSLEETSVFWSSVSELFRRLSESGDLVDGETRDAGDKVFPDALEANDGAMFIDRAVLPPTTESVVRQRVKLNPQSEYTITQRSQHGDLSEDWDHRTLVKEGDIASPGTVWSKAEKSRGHDLLEDIRQGKWVQEGGKFAQVSSGDKSSKEAGEGGHGSSITTTEGMGRDVASVKEREAHLGPGEGVEPDRNQGRGREEEEEEEEEEIQKLSQDEALSSAADKNIPLDNSKRTYIPASLKSSRGPRGFVLRDSLKSDRVTRDGATGTQHTDLETSGLYISDPRRDKPTSADISGLHNIPSVTPVAAPPRDGPWHSPGHTSPAGAKTLPGTTHLAMGGSWGRPEVPPDGGDDHGWHTGGWGDDQEDGWHSEGDQHPAWETFGGEEDYHSSLDYHHQQEGMMEAAGDPVHDIWSSGGADHDLWASGGIPHLAPAPPGLLTENDCGCWDTDAVTPEVECSCWGPLLTQVPSNLSQGVFRITLTNAGLETVRNDSFTPYRRSLHEIVLENVAKLHTIEAGAFKGLHQLRSIYIHSAPLLKTMSNITFTEDNKNLMSLRIANSGLEKIPFMKFIDHAEIVKMIELDSNRIRKVHSRSLEVKVDQLSLNYNLIECVEKEAFAGSKIGKLSLKGNTQLKSLHPEAFQGIGSLLTLDLSETSITSLPMLGLTDLEFLFLEKTPSLKVFPSVYSFKTIKEAHLTYPYHCCAFQFPEQHDPEQHIRHQNFIRMMEQEFCSEVTSPSSPVVVPATRPRRRRRVMTPKGNPQEVGSSHLLATLTTPTDEPVGEGDDDPTPMEVRTEHTNPGERWGSVSSESGSVFGLSVLSNTRQYGDADKHERPTTSDRSHPFLADPSARAMNGDVVQQYWQKLWLSGASDSLPLGGSAHPRTRHNGHHSRHIKSKMGSDNEDSRTLLPGYNFEEYKSRSRRGDHSRLARLPDTGEETHYRLLPPTPQQRTAALIRDPEKDLIPLPDKRFEEEEEGPHHHQDLDESSLGGGAVGGFHGPFLGFGSFNHTQERYLPEIPPRTNDSSPRVWGGLDQSWAGGHAAALDLGDDRTYGDRGLNAHDGSQVVSYPGKKDGLSFPNGHFPDDDHAEGLEGEIVSVSGGHDFGSSDGWHREATVNNSTLEVSCGQLSKDYHSVLCVPEPDAFNPCEDIMGNLALRVAVWLVVVTAVLGNLAVIIVLISSKFKMTVSKFLMVNLALADLCMGLYLLIIAAMDLHTIGVYFNHAIDWQNGPGCKVAGFLTVFASELSIFTLTVITSERWYAITYAIHLNKRLKLSMAVKIMVVGWAYSLSMAALPLLGISSYSKTSICLPMETGNALALAYLVSLLLVNGLAFIVITACYTSMYCSISRHDATAPHSDLTVAKRMALLVFTDFACWAPIAFFGLTAVAGVPLINVTRAKILLVFFYPLNSCANPYLYAILTKQYRRDLFILLARYGFCTKRAMRYKGAYSSVNNTFPHNTVVNAPNHRNSTLTQITLCDLTRNARTSQQSNNGSLLGTMIGGSQDSLQRNVSPLRTPTKPENCTGENERLSTVQEMSHSTHSDDEPSPDDHHHHHHLHDASSPSSGVVKQAGSPHPIKNCYTRLSFTPEQEEILKQALHESKAKKKSKTDGDATNTATSPANQASRAEEGKTTTENGKSPCHGEAIVICEVEINRGGEPNRSLSKHRGLEELEEATSTV